MTTFTEMFTGREDRERVLTEILRQGSAAPGTTTLIAHVDRVTQAVLAVRSMPTPDPIIDGGSHFAEVPILRLSAELRTIAQELAPQPIWTGNGWSAPTSELLTVVCRDGEAAITPVESQFFLGWRYSNHLTSALDGDVYVVTPQGWASLFGEWSGDLPALPTSAPPLACARSVKDAERILADASSALLDPDPGECLLCYVHRMLLEFGCDGQLRFAAHYRDARAPRAIGLERRMGRVGGYCDCEVFMNGFELRAEYWVFEVAPGQDEDVYDGEPTWPDPLPPCTGVRAGSAQPCSLWWRRFRR